MRAEDQLTQRFVQLHPAEAARQLEVFEPHAAATILALLPNSDIANVLGCCQPGVVVRIIEHVSAAQAADIVRLLPASTAFVVVRQLTPEFQTQVIAQMGPHHGPRFHRALRQPKQTAGSLADPRVLTLPPDITVEAGIQLLKGNPTQSSYYLYVVDRDAKLDGVVTMKQLLVADPQDFIGTVMNDQVVSIAAALTNEELVGHPHWQQFPTLPVVDHEGVFLGALRYRTLRQVIEENVIRSTPGSLPTALIQLWEAYSLAGIRVLTDLSQSAKDPVPSNESSRLSEHQN